MHKVLLVSLLLLLPGHALDAFAQGRDAGRDEWNRPEDVMDALGARPGSVIADIGAGFGYFTFHLAARVGPTGHVYATDIRNRRLEVIRQRVAQERLTQVHVMIGANDDPLLPVESVDAILLSNAYHDFTDYNAMMEGMFKALKPGGRLVILDTDGEPGEPRRVLYQNAHHIPKQFVLDDAGRGGFVFVKEEEGFTRPRRSDTVLRPERSWFFLIFEKPKE